MSAVTAADADLRPRSIERSAGGNLVVFSLASADRGQGRDLGRGVLAYLAADLLVSGVKLSAEPGGIERASHLLRIAVGVADDRGDDVPAYAAKPADQTFVHTIAHTGARASESPALCALDVGPGVGAAAVLTSFGGTGRHGMRSPFCKARTGERFCGDRHFCPEKRRKW